MPYLQWSDALSLDLPIMDDPHREFVGLLAQVQRSPDATLLTAWQALVLQTNDHFGQEDRWMRATRFAAINCHSLQHQVVLEVMREGLVKAAAGDLAALREMASELAQWFPKHAQSMDAALALHLHRAEYDPVTGKVHQLDALPAEAIHGCGGDVCIPAVSMAVAPAVDI